MNLTVKIGIKLFEFRNNQSGAPGQVYRMLTLNPKFISNFTFEKFPVIVNTKREWFESWFDSPYYHVLYKERDDLEARSFLDSLIGYLNPAPGSTILDVACGKGRHSLYLNQKG